MIPHQKILMSITLVTIMAVLCTGCLTAQPELTITSPDDNAVINGSSVTVTVGVKNFNLVDKLGEANVAGEGHIHYFLDAVPPTEQGKPAVTSPGTYVPTVNTSYTWQNVGIGEHTLGVELVNNDHTPLNPPVVRVIQVTLQQPGLTACTEVSDCVPAQCCHPTSCINKDYKEVCTVLCTASCEGPIDCGAGHCGCVNGQCGVVPATPIGM